MHNLADMVKALNANRRNEMEMATYIAIYISSYVLGAWLMARRFLIDFGQITLFDLIFFILFGWITPATIIAGIIMNFMDSDIGSIPVFRSRK